MRKGGLMTEMQSDLVIVARGHPRPQPRPRFVKGRVISTMSKLAKGWRQEVSSAVKKDMRRTPGWRLGTDLELFFVIPTKDKKRHGKPHVNRPDTDNLAKAVMDVLEERGALPRGDADVAGLSVKKVWGSAEQAGVQIILRPAQQTEIPAALLRQKN